MKVEVCNSTDKTVVLQSNDEDKVSVGYVLFQHKQLMTQSKHRMRLAEKEIGVGDCIGLTLPLVAPEKRGEYRYRMSIFNGVYDERNDNFHKLEVLE